MENTNQLKFSFAMLGINDVLIIGKETALDLSKPPNPHFIYKLNFETPEYRKMFSGSATTFSELLEIELNEYDAFKNSRVYPNQNDKDQDFKKKFGFDRSIYENVSLLERLTYYNDKFVVTGENRTKFKDFVETAFNCCQPFVQISKKIESDYADIRKDNKEIEKGTVRIYIEPNTEEDSKLKGKLELFISQIFELSLKKAENLTVSVDYGFANLPRNNFIFKELQEADLAKNEGGKKLNNSNTVRILGRMRKVYKVGRKKMIKYKGVQISLVEARALERQALKSKQLSK